MTVAKRGLRTIWVDGVPLCWSFRLPYCGIADCPQDLPHVMIVAASRKGRVLTCFVPPGSGPVTPARIAQCARRALAAGWRPGEGSGEEHGALPA